MVSTFQPTSSGHARAHRLINASQLAADCGAASLPVIIMADMSGTVRDVVLGFNKDLDTVVIQKMSLIK